jgi:hypothetical protein
MRGATVCRRVVGPLVIIGALLGSSSAAEAAADDYDEPIARALRLLPRQPHKVVVVDAHASPGLLENKLHHVEGFVTEGERVVYLVRQGVTLQRTLSGSGIFDYALATVIWHEMAHIDGADEATAQKDEEDLWMEFVLTRRVDAVRGMKYLALLKERRVRP